MKLIFFIYLICASSAAPLRGKRYDPSVIHITNKHVLFCLFCLLSRFVLSYALRHIANSFYCHFTEIFLLISYAAWSIFTGTVVTTLRGSRTVGRKGSKWTHMPLRQFDITQQGQFTLKKAKEGCLDKCQIRMVPSFLRNRLPYVPRSSLHRRPLRQIRRWQRRRLRQWQQR